MTERHQEETSSLSIGQEKELLTKEKRFFESRLSGNYVGVLTNSRIGIVSGLYPEIIDGMQGLYYYLEKDSTDPMSEEGFMNRHIRNVYSTATTLLSNEEIEKLRKDMSDGKYSDQFAIVRKFKNIAMASQSASGRGEKRFDAYKAVSNDTDLVYNKRVCLQRVHGLKNDLQEVYGEVNYGQALLTELLVSAPFIDTVIRRGDLDKDVTERHKAYIDEAAEFTSKLAVDERVQKFEDLTKQYTTSWTYEKTPYKLPDYDKEYIQRAYELAGRVMDGDWSLEDVHGLLSETLLRRGKVFIASLEKHNFVETKLIITPEQPSETGFDDIAGYQDQKEFLQTLLDKTGKQDPIVEDIRMVISAGKPGLGKSLGVKAFLNNLPPNAKGVVLDTENFNRNEEMVEYKFLEQLANLHPDLHIFAVIEDIDALAGNRLQNAATKVFLQIDSVGAEANPRNLHLIATTNRPDVIDSAVTRPGRTAKILVYQPPEPEERKKVAQYHAGRNHYDFSDDLLDNLTKMTDGFTPDEIRYVVWSLRFADVENPSTEDIEKYTKDVEARRKIEIEASGKKTGFRN